MILQDHGSAAGLFRQPLAVVTLSERSDIMATSHWIPTREALISGFWDLFQSTCNLLEVNITMHFVACFLLKFCSVSGT